MNNYSLKSHRRSIRLQGYDYNMPGAYFVTICTHHHKPLFGQVVDGEMRLNQAGRVANDQWSRLGVRFNHIELSEFVIMPNHMHGILILIEGCRGAGGDLESPSSNHAPLRPYGGAPIIPGSLGAIVRTYKASVTNRLHAKNINLRNPVWQRNYYEHIIRNEDDLRMITEYIANNPLNWGQDELQL